MTVLLQYVRHRKGGYYCRNVLINDQKRKLSDVQELL